MPKPKNTVARVIVPIVGVLAMIGVGWAFYLNGATGPKAAPVPNVPAGVVANAPAATTSAVPANTPPTPAATPPKAEVAAIAATQPPTAPPAVAPVTGTTYAARTFEGDPIATDYAPLGTLASSKDDRTLMRVEFSSNGAGILAIKLAEFFETIEKKDHVPIQREHSVVVSRDAGGAVVEETKLTPFAAISIRVNGQNVLLFGSPSKPVWKQIAGSAPGHFEAFIMDGAGQDVLRLERRFTKVEKAYDLKVAQKITNLSAAPVKVQFYQIGPVDMPRDRLAYVGDRRRVHFGYLLDPTGDPSRSVVLAEDFLVDHPTLLGKRESGGTFLPELEQWPNDRSKKKGLTLVWAGLTNRYFGVAVMPDFVPGAGAPKGFSWVGAINRVVLDMGFDADKVDQSVAGLRLDGAEALLDPAGGVKDSQDLSHVIFVGPLDADVFAATEPTKSLGLEGLIVHNMGGPCAFCTFDWLTGTLLWLLQMLHDYLAHDWAISIMLLVLVVRTILHPVTKWSQVRMTRFGKQMQAFAPKMKALQEKYANDKVRLQQETGRLYKEEGVNPAQMLGCLPMLLQTPVWIALYATLFFAVELRHQSGFFGVFQSIQGATSPFYQFFGDLAEPDRLWYWGTPFKIPLLSSMIGPISSLNILPFVLGVVFFVQQKYLKPPTTSTLTPEQEMQQKMVQWMMVILFPFMMYPAPAGLTLYFVTNSVLSILENKYIRGHIEELDKKNPPGKKKATGEATGFMQRVMAAAEAKRRAMEEAQAKAQKNARKKK